MIPMSRISADATDAAMDGGRELTMLAEALTANTNALARLGAAVAEGPLPVGRRLGEAFPHANRLADAVRVAAPVGTAQRVVPVRVVNFKDFGGGGGGAAGPASNLGLGAKLARSAGGSVGLAAAAGPEALLIAKVGQAIGGPLNQAVDSVFGKALKPLSDAIGAAVKPVADLAGAVLAAGSGFSVLVGPLKLLGVGTELLAKGFEVLAVPTKILSDVVGGVADALTGLADLVKGIGGNVVSSVAAPFKAIGGAATEGAKALGQALADPINGVPGLVGKLRPFVEAVNPYSLLQFDQAVKDAQAALGIVLVPIVRELGTVARSFADVLYGAVGVLKGPFAAAAQGLGAVLRTGVEVFGQLLQATAPLGSLLADVFRDAAGAVALFGRVVLPPVIGLGQALINGFGGLLKGVFGFNGSLISLTGSVLRAGAALAIFAGKLVSLLSFGLVKIDVAGMLKSGLESLAPKRDSRGLAAATNPEFRGIADIGREAAKQAFIAGNTPGGEPGPGVEEQIREEIAKIGETIDQFDDLDLEGVLERAFQKALRAVLTGFKAQAETSFGGAGRAAADWIFGTG